MKGQLILPRYKDRRNIIGNPFEEPTKKKKRAKLSASQRIYIWEHPKLYGRRCNICGQRITKMSELELDHTRAHSKGGKRMALAHSICNRMKRTNSLKFVQKSIGVKTSKRKSVKRRHKKIRYTTNIWGQRVRVRDNPFF